MKKNKQVNTQTNKRRNWHADEPASKQISTNPQEKRTQRAQVKTIIKRRNKKSNKRQATVTDGSQTQ